MESIYYVYDPHDHNSGYIGHTCKNVQSYHECRMRKVKKNKSSTRFLHRWILKLLREEREPVVEVIEAISIGDRQEKIIRAKERETYWIVEYRRQGYQLKNLTNGGEGPKKQHSFSKFKEDNPFYGKHHTEETKDMIRRKQVGKTHTEQTKKQMSETHKSLVRSNKHCQSISRSKKQQWAKWREEERIQAEELSKTAPQPPSFDFAEWLRAWLTAHPKQ